ncbi:MAG TPA: MEDS domain-containing protein [Bacteroidales bacterium]
MDEKLKSVPTGFTKEDLPDHVHACMIYDSEEQRRKVISRYLSIGLQRGESVSYITASDAPEDINSWLQEMGVDTNDALKNNSFSIYKAEDYYYPGGRFEPEKLLDGMNPYIETLRNAGYKGVRISGEMSWALKEIPGADRIVEFEVIANKSKETFPYSGICQYDARLFDGATLFKILQAHPYMIANGQLVQNPYYIKSEEFCSENT